MLLISNRKLIVCRNDQYLQSYLPTPSVLSLFVCVCFALCRVYKTQNRRKEALSQCEKALQLLKDCGQPEKMISVYRDMAAVEHDSGHLDRAVEHLSKASSTSRAQHTELLSNIYQHMSVLPPLDMWYDLYHMGVSARLMPLLWVTVQRSWWGLKSPTAWRSSFLLQQSPIRMVSLPQTQHIKKGLNRTWMRQRREHMIQSQRSLDPFT